MESLTTTEPILLDGAGSIALLINPELHSLIPPLTAEEFAQLAANIVEEGCREPLVVWQETRALLDGHNRYDICTSHGISYTTVEVSLPSLDAAKAWMIANQLGRRNLTPEQTSYYRGEQYNLLKRQGRRRDRTSPHSEEKFPNPAHALAAQFKVGRATIERDGAYARAVDTLAEALGPDVRQSILARESHLTQGQVKALAAIATKNNPQTAQRVLVEAQQAPTPKAARKIVQAAVRYDKHLDAVAQDLVRAELGIARCGDCGRPLSDPDSISRGIGPICACKPPAASWGPSAGAPSFTLTPEPEPDETPIDPTEAVRQDAERQAEIQARQYRQCVRLLGQLVEAYGFASVKADVWDVVCAQWAPVTEPDPVEPPVAADVTSFSPVVTSEDNGQVTENVTVVTSGRAKHGELQRRVAAALESFGEQGATAPMVGTALGVSAEAAWKALASLVKKGSAVKVGNLYLAKDAAE